MNDSASAPPRICDYLAATADEVANNTDALRAELSMLEREARQAGLSLASGRPALQSASPDVALTSAGANSLTEGMDSVRRGLQMRTELLAALPQLEILAAQERKQSRGPLVLLALVAIIALIVLIGQVI